MFRSYGLTLDRWYPHIIDVIFIDLRKILQLLVFKITKQLIFYLYALVVIAIFRVTFGDIVGYNSTSLMTWTVSVWPKYWYIVIRFMITYLALFKSKSEDV